MSIKKLLYLYPGQQTGCLPNTQTKPKAKLVDSKPFITSLHQLACELGQQGLDCRVSHKQSTLAYGPNVVSGRHVFIMMPNEICITPQCNHLPDVFFETQDAPAAHQYDEMANQASLFLSRYQRSYEQASHPLNGNKLALLLSSQSDPKKALSELSHLFGRSYAQDFYFSVGSHLDRIVALQKKGIDLRFSPVSNSNVSIGSKDSKAVYGATVVLSEQSEHPIHLNTTLIHTPKPLLQLARFMRFNRPHASYNDYAKPQSAAAFVDQVLTEAEQQFANRPTHSQQALKLPYTYASSSDWPVLVVKKSPASPMQLQQVALTQHDIKIFDAQTSFKN